MFQNCGVESVIFLSFYINGSFQKLASVFEFLISLVIKYVGSWRWFPALNLLFWASLSLKWSISMKSLLLTCTFMVFYISNTSAFEDTLFVSNKIRKIIFWVIITASIYLSYYHFVYCNQDGGRFCSRSVFSLGLKIQEIVLKTSWLLVLAFELFCHTTVRPYTIPALNYWTRTKTTPQKKTFLKLKLW